MDTHKRTIYKTVTFRIMATIITVGSIYLWTNSWSVSLGSGLFANFLKTIAYYVHERAWNRSTYGKVVVPVEHDNY